VTVETSRGLLAGRATSAGVEFLGIPYAVAARFAPPTRAPAWTGEREATQPGPAAPQPPRAVATFTHGELPATAEDGSLVLNVYTPAVGGRRPVFVWVHGGGFAVGHASASLYHGAALAIAADVVVVTLNYRLGSLGWLSHPELAAADGAPAGNWGLLDQVAALEWVRDNIDRFGGDPGRVTLAGQSAGALCVIDLLVNPGADGLFRRAVLQSPPFGDLAQPGAAAHRWAEALSESAGGVGSFDGALLRSLPAGRIVALHEALLEQEQFRGTRGGALPTIDPATLPRSPLEDPGARAGVDVLIGSTADEGTFFFGSPWRPAPPADAVATVIGHLTGGDPDPVIARYRARAIERGRPDDAVSLLADIATDAVVADPVASWARARSQAGGRVHRYRVDHPGAGPQLRATHTVEVPLLFGTWRDGGPGERLAGQGSGTSEVAAALVETWTSFIHGEAPPWRAVSETPGQIELGVFGGGEPFAVQTELDKRSVVPAHG
jgi:para-nitrobenzyl esterase